MQYKIVQQGAKYLGIIFSEKGLAYTTVPFEDRERVAAVINKVINTKLQDIEVKEAKEIPKYVNTIFAMDENLTQEKWEQSQQIPIDYLLATEKEKQVLKALKTVPYGSIITYGELGEKAGFTKNYARFIGNTMGKNPFPLIIPCHRVVTHNHKLGNYSAFGSVAHKKRYLNAEGAKL